jgi:amino acid permease
LWAIHHHPTTHTPEVIIVAARAPPEQSSSSLFRKLSALGSIGFAVGSQKLFLNIRHDLADRSDAPKTLGLSLSLFGLAYIGLCFGAGSDPPGFLLDAIPPHTWNRRIAGLLLFVHVIVSYGEYPSGPFFLVFSAIVCFLILLSSIAINSQALCSSLDRLMWRRLQLPAWSAPKRWLVLTTLLAITAYSVANAIPFFTDLIAFIGAISSVPLTLLFPALYWRKLQNVALWGFTPVASAALTYFAILFAVVATVGSMDSIRQDWSTHGPPFSCK